MPIQQVAFEVPVDIAMKLATGELVQYGGIVRDAAGHIVKHLKPVQDLAEDNAGKALAVAATAIKANKKIAIGIGAAAAALAAGGVIVHKILKDKEESTEQAGCESFNEALSAYCAAMQSGSMEQGHIDRLIAEIDSLATQEDGKVTISIPKKQLTTLVDVVYDYSVALSEANGFDSSEIRRPSDKSTIIALSGFRDCLVRQKEIFEKAA